jgi:hypothetical protein
MRMNQDLTISTEDKNKLKDAKTCYPYKGPWTDTHYKVRDQDHSTGRYRGACHNRCNILHFSNRYLPVFFIILKATTLITA